MPATPGSRFEYTNRAVSNVAFDAVAETVRVFRIRVHNRTAVATTITIKDKATTPVECYTAKDVPTNDSFTEDFGPFGKVFTGGINVVASVDNQLVLEIQGEFAGR